MKVLLTGATGFVGLNLLLRLLERDDVERIAVCVRHGGKLHSLLAREGFCGLPQKITVIESDSANWRLESLPFPPDVCIHCAGVLFARTRGEYFRGNIDGTRNLLSSLPGTTRVIVLSSQAAVGPTPQNSPPLDESATPRPLSYYGQSKQAMEEMLAREFARRGNLVVLRPPTVLGPRDSATLPLFQMVNGPVWFKPGTMEKQLSWIGVGDLVDAILEVMDDQNLRHGVDPETLPVYFVSAETPVTDRDLIQTTASILQRKGILIPIPKVLLKLVARISKVVPAIGRAVPSLMPDRARELWEDRWLVSGKRFADTFSWRTKQNLQTVLSEQAAFLKKNKIIK